MRYDFDVRPDTAIASLKIIEERAGNLRKPLTAIRGLMLKDQARNWMQQGSVFGDKWSDVTPETRARKYRQGITGRGMRASGALETAAKGGKGKYTRITKSSLTVGINKRIFYARFHQAGAEGPRKGQMDKRQVVGITRTTERTAIKLIARYIDA